MSAWPCVALRGPARSLSISSLWVRFHARVSSGASNGDEMPCACNTFPHGGGIELCYTYSVTTYDT